MVWTMQVGGGIEKVEVKEYLLTAKVWSRCWRCALWAVSAAALGEGGVLGGKHIFLSFKDWFFI